MPKKTPAQRFHDLFKLWTAGATEGERASGEKKAYEWLAKNGKKESDISELVAQAFADDLAANPPPPPPDPRIDESVRFDRERHSPANLVEAIVKMYVTMTEHVRVIFTLCICFTHVYTRFRIAPRVALESRRAGAGKSTALEVGRSLAFRPNEEGIGTGAALEDHFLGDPCSLFLDETEHGDAADIKRVKRIWNNGHKAGPGSKISKVVAGKKRIISLHAPVFLAGVKRGIGRLLMEQQQTRTLRLEMRKYTEETKPPRDHNIEEEVDHEAFRSVYSLLCGWAEKAKLNPNPLMPAGVIARDADNFRGLLAIADDCGGEWPRRAREALVVLLEQREAERPGVVLLWHGLEIFKTLELERIKTSVFDAELRKLDMPGMDWRRYRGPGGDEIEHVITPGERAELLREFDIETKVMKPAGGGKTFRGLERSWFETALRKEGAAAAPRLRLIPSPQGETA